jgi:hypothetical protein
MLGGHFKHREPEVPQSHGESGMPNPKYDAYMAADPYFDLARGALGDLVEGPSQSRHATALELGDCQLVLPRLALAVAARERGGSVGRAPGDLVNIQESSCCPTHSARERILHFSIHG